MGPWRPTLILKTLLSPTQEKAWLRVPQVTYSRRCVGTYSYTQKMLDFASMSTKGSIRSADIYVRVVLFVTTFIKYGIDTVQRMCVCVCGTCPTFLNHTVWRVVGVAVTSVDAVGNPSQSTLPVVLSTGTQYLS